jgi:hypothetical protein
MQVAMFSLFVFAAMTAVLGQDDSILQDIPDDGSSNSQKLTNMNTPEYQGEPTP